MPNALTIFATDQVTRRVGLGLLLAIALLYLFTLDNGLRPDELTGGDLITHQYAQVEARPSNAPGYPLYTIGGWIWFRLGRGLLGHWLNPIQLLSLYSALWGLAALALLYLILLGIFQQRRFHQQGLAMPRQPLRPAQRPFDLRALAGSWLPAALLTAFHGITFFFWYYSVTTEQYTSAVFQTLLLIWLAFNWDEEPSDTLLLAMALVSGTMLANMVTTLFILPPLLGFIVLRRGPDGPFFLTYLKRPKLILQVTGLTGLPLLSYAYIYIRGAQHPEWRGLGNWPTAWAWFVDFLTIQQGRDELVPGLRWQTFFTDEFPWLMGWELTWPVFFGGLFGLVWLGPRRAILLGATLAIYMIFCWSYRFGNWFQVIIPAYPIFTIGFGAGLAWLMDRYDASQSNTGPLGQDPIHETSAPRLVRQPVGLLASMFLAGLLAFRLLSNLPRANQHDRPGDTGLDPGWAILADRPSVPAVVSASFEERLALDYLTRVWGLAPGLIPTGAGDFIPPPQIIEPVPGLYLTRQGAAAAPGSIRFEEVYPQAAGEHLIELPSIPPTRLPPAAAAFDLAFADSLRLIGWEQIEPNSALPASISVANWRLALYWRADAPLPLDYTISVRPLIMGQTIFDGEALLIQDHQPVWGLYPTSRWTPGAIVRDVYALDLPSNIQPDAVQVVVYYSAAGGFENVGEVVVNIRSAGSSQQ
jgi:hypothetical protein